MTTRIHTAAATIAFALLAVSTAQGVSPEEQDRRDRYVAPEQLKIVKAKRAADAIAAAEEASLAEAEERARVAAVEAACPASFPERLADAQRAIPLSRQLQAEAARVVPWFDAHCRFLSALERAIRKLDDDLSFVCDTTVGRPKGLTGKRYLELSGGGLSVVDLQDRAVDSQRCAEVDPVSLDMHTPPVPAHAEGTEAHELWQLLVIQREFEVLCYGAKGAKAARCAKNQAQTAALIAKIQAERATREKAGTGLAPFPTD